MTSITIDEEFRALIAPLKIDELGLLEAAIVEADGATDPLKTWNGLLLDANVLVSPTRPSRSRGLKTGSRRSGGSKRTSLGDVIFPSTSGRRLPFESCSARPRWR